MCTLRLLITDPRPLGCSKLSGFKDHWRVRVRDWRIVYRIEDGRLVVLVVTVAPRGGVYVRGWCTMNAHRPLAYYGFASSGEVG
jgi:mRNA-degrading endonuclease RelE of RelBE toxin-antitoxin system